MKKTVIITLTYNKLETATKPYLESLYKFTDEEMFDLVVVDNASSDGTAEYVKEFSKNHANITLICNEENLGYSKGNNMLLKSILYKGYKYIALLNNDILLTPNWLENTIEGFNLDKQLGLISPRSNEKCSLRADNYIFGYKKYLAKFKENLRYVIAPYFSCVLIKKEVLDKIGLFDEAFTPAFWEDYDLSLRAMYAGYSCAYINSTFIFHNHSTTSSSISNDIYKRNEQYFYKKHPLGRYIWEHKRTNILKNFIKYIKESYK